MPTLLIFFRKPQLFPKAGLSTEALCKQLGGQPSDLELLTVIKPLNFDENLRSFYRLSCCFFSDPNDSPMFDWDTRPGTPLTKNWWENHHFFFMGKLTKYLWQFSMSRTVSHYQRVDWDDLLYGSSWITHNRYCLMDFLWITWDHQKSPQDIKLVLWGAVNRRVSPS